VLGLVALGATACGAAMQEGSGANTHASMDHRGRLRRCDDGDAGRRRRADGLSDEVLGVFVSKLTWLQGRYELIVIGPASTFPPDTAVAISNGVAARFAPTAASG